MRNLQRKGLHQENSKNLLRNINEGFYTRINIHILFLSGKTEENKNTRYFLFNIVIYNKK